MAARIRSLRNFATPIDEASRDDLVATDVVTVQSLDAATTYAWALPFVPDGSTATFSGDPTAVSPGSFTVDEEGSYLVRLIVDATLPTESTQYVRLRALTTDLGLKLVAAGERRDESGIIPVDASVAGWANDQNANLLALEAALGSLDLQDAYGAGNIVVLTNASTPIIIRAGAAPSAQLLSFLKTGGAGLGLVSHPSADQFRVAAANGVGTGNGNALGLFAGSAVGGTGVGGSLVLRPGAGFGGGVSGETVLQNAAGTFQVGLHVSAADTVEIRAPGGGGLPLAYNVLTGKLTVPGLIDPTGVVFELAPAPSTGATEGALFISDGAGGLTLGAPYFRGPSSATPVAVASGSEHFESVTISPGGTVNTYWFAPAPITIVAIKLYAATAPTTAGTYAFTATGAGNNLLGAASFDLTSLPSDALTSAPLTGTAVDLNLATGAKVAFSFASNNGDLTGAGLCLQVLYTLR